MATPSTPESPARAPLTPSNSTQRYPRSGDLKENSGSPKRRPIPGIELADAGRIHEAPKSPIKVNVRAGDWPPRPSTGIIENGDDFNENDAVEQQQYQSEQYGRIEPMLPVSQEMPYRPSYNNNSYRREDTREPEPVVYPYRNNATHPSNGSVSSPQGTGRGYAGQVNENENQTGYEEEPEVAPVPRLSYYHQQASVSDSGLDRRRTPQPGDMVAAGQSINRHLTPTSHVQRPMSTYSDTRGRSPYSQMPGSPMWGARATSTNSRGSNGGRPLSYIDLAHDLADASYPQKPPAVITMDNSQLRSVVGTNASLLTINKTLEMYRQNMKKLNGISEKDAEELQYAFAMYLLEAAKIPGLAQESQATPRKASPKPGGRDSPQVDTAQLSVRELQREAKHVLQKLADRGEPFSQYYLADGYASGLFSKNGEEDYHTAFPLFVAASKKGHAESGYRAALCYEFGWGTRKDPAKAVQFYRQAASKSHPGAMTRLGRACITKDLGLDKYREGVKWLKRATESADTQYNQAPYHLAQLYAAGDGEDIFKDESYAAQLFTQAAELGHAGSCYILGDAYEHGKLTCPRDPGLSVHFYTGAALAGHSEAMYSLCAWYLVGAEPILKKDEDEAYEWAKAAAAKGLVKAEYAVAYFTETGIGCRRDPLEANVWYVKAADGGDERAKNRLATIRAAASGGIPMEVAPPRNGKIKKSDKGGKTPKDDKTPKDEKDCIVM